MASAPAVPAASSEAASEAAPAEDRAEQPPGVLLRVSYVGDAFAGWAPQPDARTGAGVLLEAVRRLDPSVSEVRGASRTDAGVHARRQPVAFDPERSIPLRGWVLGLARHLPRDLAVVEARLVERGFAPRFASRGKHYRYLVLREPVPDPFWWSRAWRVGELAHASLWAERLSRARHAAAQLVGTHDFAAFRSSKDARLHTTRHVSRVELHALPADPRVLAIDVEGSGFLHHMVRIIAGTLVDVALGRRPVECVARALASRERSLLGVTAPACGLWLEDVRLEPPALPSLASASVSTCWPDRTAAESACAAEDPERAPAALGSELGQSDVEMVRPGTAVG